MGSVEIVFPFLLTPPLLLIHAVTPHRFPFSDDHGATCRAGLNGSEYVDYEKYWQDPIRENETLRVLS